MSVSLDRPLARQTNMPWILGIVFVAMMAAVFTAGNYIHSRFPSELERIASFEAAGSRLRGQTAEILGLDHQIQNYVLSEDATRGLRRDRRAVVEQSLHADIDVIAQAMTDEKGTDAVRKLKDALAVYAEASEDADAASIVAGRSPTAGVRGDYADRAAELESLFETVAASGGIARDNFLAMRAAHERFFRDQGGTSISDGNAALNRVRTDIRTASGLTDANRAALRLSTDAYAAAFGKLAPTLLRRTEARRALDREFDRAIPAIEQVSTLITAQAALQRADILNRSERVTLFTALIGLVAATMFLTIAVPTSRRLMANEQRLREANARLRDFAQTSSDIFWEIDSTGTVTRVEGPTGRYSEVYMPRFVGRKFTDVLDLYKAEFTKAFDIASIWGSGRAFKDLLFRGEYPESGETVWYSLSGTPIFAQNGTVEMYRCSARNVTASEQARQEGEVFRRQLEAIISHLPVAVYQYEWKNGDGRVTFASENVERLLGATLKDFNAHHSSEGHWFLHPEDRERLTQEVAAGFQATGRGKSRGRVTVNGETRWIEETASLRSGTADGDFVVEGMWLDVTDDVHKAQRLSDFMSAIDSSADFFMIADAETHRIEYCNTGYLKLAGLPEHGSLPELYLGTSGNPIGQSFEEFFTPVKQAVKRDGHWVGERDWHLRDGRIQTQFIRISQLAGNRLLIILTDITAERARTRELQNITAAVAASADAIVTFAPNGGPIIYANPSTNRILGIAANVNLTGRLLSEFVTPEDTTAKELRDNIERTVERGESIIRRRNFRRRDGSALTLLSRASGLPDGNIIIVMTDMTEVATLEREVAERKDELDRLIRNLPGVAYRLRCVNDEYLSDYVSERLERISGYSAEEINHLNDTRGLLACPEDIAMRHKALKDSRETGKPYELSWRLRCKDGTIRWMHEVGNHFRQANGIVTAQGYTADITERVKYEEDLRWTRAENAVVVSALNSAHESIAISDATGKVMYTNAAFAALLEIEDGADALKTDLGAFFRRQGEDWNKVITELLTATARDGHWTGELFITTERNTEKRLRVHATSSEGERIIYLATDVTQEAALREAQELQTNLLAGLSTDQSIVWADINAAAGRIVEAFLQGLSATHATLWMLEPDGVRLRRTQYIGGTPAVPNTPVVLDTRDYPEYWDLLARERIVAISDTLSPGPSELRPYVEFAGLQAAILDVPIMRAGQVVGVLTCRCNSGVRNWSEADKRFAVHISDFAALSIEAAERQGALVQLKTANTHLQAVVTALDSTQDRIAIEGADGRITYVNRPLADAIGGGNPGNLIGRSFIQTIEALLDDVPQLERRMRKELDAAGTWSGEFAVKSPRGRRHLDVRVSRLSDGGVLYAATDKTDRHERDLEEAELKRQLADAQRMETIGRLAGGIAHDFNNIIGAARGFADLISSDLPRGSTHQVYASRIVSTCQRASELVREIMTFSRAAQGERQAVRVKDILSESMAMMAETVPSGLELTCFNGVGVAAVEANPSQMIQILTNLTLNSRDAIERADGRISIRAEKFRMESSQLASMAPGYHEETVGKGRPLMRLIEGGFKLDQEYVRLSVEDNGSGMSKTTLQKIFEPFFTTKDRSRGTGLGVPTVASIVAAHRGAIRISTRQGHGTCFDIFIPVTYKDAEVLAERRDTADVTGRERILIVDDEIDLADAMSLGLQRLGYEAVPLYSPREALQIFKEAPDAWDVIITDQVMPEMEGMQLIKKLKAVRKDIKIILYTGHSENATPAEVKKIGAELFLYKPVTAEDLAGAVRGLFPV